MAQSELPEEFIKDLLGRQDIKNLTIESLMDNGKRTDEESRNIIVQLKTFGIFGSLVKQDSKIFNDPIHGHIQLHPACLAIIDTPQFQRLRQIKQLGMCYYVYPGASHNRFEHSLGACYLAGQFARTLQENQPYLGISDKDILCVEIAGLCHDLGHGPISHVFDGRFIPDVYGDTPTDWTHEKASIDMLQSIIKENKMMEEGGALKNYKLDEHDIIFIKEMIYGELEGNEKLIGREPHKHYLYEIVSNKRNGIDVDKWDYFARDCHHLGIKNNFDYSRYMKFARVIKANGEWQICIREKEISNLYNMFYTRYTLHKIAYQHRVTKTIDSMISEALVKANDDLKFIGEDGASLKMSECIKDMKAYAQLTDNVLFQILNSESNSESMKEAKEIIQNILKRKLYRSIYESDPLEPKDFAKMKDEEIVEQIIQRARELDGSSQYNKKDISIQRVKLDFGMKDKNPVEKLLVYSKGREDEAFVLPQEKASRILGPINYSEMFLRVVYHRSDENFKVLKQASTEVFEDLKTTASSSNGEINN